jgi:hypothetical protein
MGQEFNNWVVAIVRPPLVVLRFVIEKSYSLVFGWWLDKRLVSRSNQRFGDDVRRHIAFLFDDYGARIIPNGPEPPASFDFALVTLSVGDLIFRFFRGRGDVTMNVASTRAPNDWHELSALLGVMDLGVQRRAFTDLADIGRILRLHMNEIRQALSPEHYRNTQRLLYEVYEHDHAVTRQWSAEINRRLYPDN